MSVAPGKATGVADLREALPHDVLEVPPPRRTVAGTQTVISAFLYLLPAQTPRPAAHGGDVGYVADSRQAFQQGTHGIFGGVPAQSAAAGITNADIMVSGWRHASLSPVAEADKALVGVERVGAVFRRGKRQVLEAFPAHPAVLQDMILTLYAYGVGARTFQVEQLTFGAASGLVDPDLTGENGTGQEFKAFPGLIHAGVPAPAGAVRLRSCS